MKCKICSSDVSFLFKLPVLKKYETPYFKCNKCGFVQTSDPFWLKEAYSEAITNLDIGYVGRNIVCRNLCASVIDKIFNSKKMFLDYGGGYGLFVRLMRDLGYDYYRQDNYCQNIFSKCFDVNDLTDNPFFEMVSAFEVFEHLDNPLEEIERMLTFSDSVFFSTELLPFKKNVSKEWYYFAPETGQHIAFYTLESLNIIAEKYQLNIYSDSRRYHLLTKRKLKYNKVKTLSFLKKIMDQLLQRNFYNKHSLINVDLKKVTKKGDYNYEGLI